MDKIELADRLEAQAAEISQAGHAGWGNTMLIAAALRESEWRPIESAPKDGTPVLGYADGDMTTVQWVQCRLVDDGYWSLTQCGLHADDGEWWPERWMPLPPPPTIDAARKEG